MIYRFIAPGTHIVSDCFRAYCRIEDITERDFTHTSVNHEVEYVNEDGEHTNNIEALWSTLKRAIPPRVRSKKLVQPYIFEQMWRDTFKGSGWDAILFALRVVKYEKSFPAAEQETFNIM